MKNYLIGFVLFILAGISTGAQTRILVGPAGGIDFNNETFGGVLQIRQPITKHFEISLTDTASPIESHLGVGTGFSNITNIGGIVWLAQHFGISGSGEYSMYNVTTARKGAYYTQFGPIFRLHVSDFPARLSFGGSLQVHNGISADGIESSHLKGAYAELEILLGCAGKFCVLTDEKLDGGRVLEQGNPACDGTFGVTGGPGGGPCFRTAANGGGFTGSLKFQFPRHKDDETNLF